MEQEGLNLSSLFTQFSFTYCTLNEMSPPGCWPSSCSMKTLHIIVTKIFHERDTSERKLELPHSCFLQWFYRLKQFLLFSNTQQPEWNCSNLSVTAFPSCITHSAHLLRRVQSRHYACYSHVYMRPVDCFLCASVCVSENRFSTLH